MPTELAYHDNPTCLEFDAEISARVVLPDGRRGVVLPRTFFFPTGGGQEHDTGTLGDARVTEVIIDDAGMVTHVVDRPILENRVAAKIDRARRVAFMQHHSAQHVLSAALDHALGLETVSANINIANPATIDLAASGHAEIDLTPGENLANAIVCEDRPIQAYWITDAQVATTPFRRPPKVSGAIRVIAIATFDYSACGGTHCARTGMIGAIKIVRVERRVEKLRVHFVAGARAFALFQTEHALVSALARQFDTHPDALLDAITRQSDALRAAQKQLDALRELQSQVEAQQLIARAEVFGTLRLIVAPLADKSAQELRALAMRLQNVPGIVALLATFDGAKLSLVVTCASDTGVRANDLLRRQLAPINGRGGGDAKLAQGGGATSAEQFTTFFADTREHLRTLRG